MKRIISLLLCLLMLASILLLPVSAAIFQVRYYEEEIYAGGVLDLYAFPYDGGVEPFTYQWQAEGFGWIDLEDNEVYKGTKTNHLRLYTKTGDYGDFSSIPFQCAVTDAEGTTFYTPEIYPEIYPTENMLSNLGKWGYGLYEPTLTNVKNLKTSDDKNYTATAYSGAKVDLFIGSKPVTDKAILENSEVKLTREIHITEYGYTTKTTDKTTYIPYTVGTVKVEFKLNVKIGSTDLGTFDTKTVNITTSKPDAIARGVTTKECSMLRYPYNESEKLSSIPKGATVEVIAQEGSYYQVYYNNQVGYVGSSLLTVDTSVGDSVIKHIDVTIDKPVAGQIPAGTCIINTTGCELYKTDPVTWTDDSGKIVKATDKFQEGKRYTVSIWVAAKSGYRFQTDASYKPKLTGFINGNLPPFINKAYEQDPEQVIELTYTFGNTKAPEETVPTVPTEPSHNHTPSDWRITGAYHYKACTTCGDFLEQEDHKGGTATCVEKAKCTVCGTGYGEISDHRWSPTWLYQDATGHAWVCADCKNHSDIKPHTPGPAATETEPQKCKDCGYIIEPAKNHTHKLTKVAMTPATCLLPGNMEYYVCDGCSDRFTDAQGKNTIPAGMEVAIAPLGHTPSEVWGTDDVYHWRVCTACNTVMDETKMLHEETDGKCATCSFVIGSDNPAQEAADEETKPDDKTSGDTETVPAVSAPESQTPQPKEKKNIGWAMAVMVGLVCFGASITATVIILKRKKK